MPTSPRREKRIHRQYDEQCCRWILFLWKRKARTRCAGEKRGGSVPVAERVVRRTGGKGQKVGWRGMKKSGDALSKRTGESKKRTGYNLKARRRIEKQMARNRKTRNRRIKVPGPKSERAREPKSESVRAGNQKACNLPTTL